MQFCLLDVPAAAHPALRNYFRLTSQSIFSERLITSDYIEIFLMQLNTMHPIYLKVTFRQKLVDLIYLKPLVNN